LQRAAQSPRSESKHMSENTARPLVRPDRMCMNLSSNIWNYMGSPLTQRNSNMLMGPFFYVQWVCLLLIYFEADVDSDGW